MFIFRFKNKQHQSISAYTHEINVDQGIKGKIRQSSGNGAIRKKFPLRNGSVAFVELFAFLRLLSIFAFVVFFAFVFAYNFRYPTSMTFKNWLPSSFDVFSATISRGVLIFMLYASQRT